MIAAQPGTRWNIAAAHGHRSMPAGHFRADIAASHVSLHNIDHDYKTR